ncbi:hypothetical protein [Lagierella sp.]|uniref:hypothetical protein n=1 Tax=Lagierella sp. TaxID=2849657 RepID=UPI0026147661|nr:hypothetical protein [Lagierella sp.]
MILKIPVVLKSNIPEENIKRVLEEIENTEDVDLILYEEGFLQGYDSMSFDYKEDVKSTLFENSKEIVTIKKALSNKNFALGFGYYENYKGGIYSSYMLMGTGGEEGFNYRSLSPKWKAERACADYREGEKLYSYGVKDKEIGIVLGEDFLDEEILPQIVDMDAKVDLFYWSHSKEFADSQKAESEYLKVSEILDKPVLLFTRIMEDGTSLKGRIQLMLHGKVIKDDMVDLGESYIMGL